MVAFVDQVREEKYRIDDELALVKLDYLRNSKSLWDMRAWNKLKDPDEVMTYVERFRPPMKNDQQAARFVYELNCHHLTPKQLIYDAIMENPHVSFEFRLVPCLYRDTPFESKLDACPVYRSCGNQVASKCWLCTKNQKQ